ncbi:hypothetical protein Glove_166g116 [Diversispora epigaea]|uniref:Uncharacterized protein n=1 Tax=Diversispora epigaea TaxID=1348612 RepID=A0A397IQK2_9GLOM|nr:hypothetical protein Glove_166g116 [Diversispora epigaea]
MVTVSTNSIINWIKSKYVDNKKKDPGFVRNIEITGLIRNTPLVRIKRKAEVTGCDYAIYDPKDRVALDIIKKAEEKGLIKTKYVMYNI